MFTIASIVVHTIVDALTDPCCSVPVEDYVDLISLQGLGGGELG